MALTQEQRPVGLDSGEVVPANEASAIAQIVKKSIENVNAAARKEGFARRDAHVKSHGLARGTFEVLADAPAADDNWSRRGLFSEAKSYPCWIRFSNAAAQQRSDRVPDVRGLALKVMGIEGTGALGNAITTHDFVLIDSPTFVVADAAGFAGFFGARKRGVVAAVRTFLRGLLLLNCAKTPLRTYFSATPFLLVEEAVKYRLRPLTQSKAASGSAGSAHVLYDAVESHLLRQDFVYEFQIQRRTQPESMPIEDATVEWKETDSPFVTVARLHIPAQTLADGRRESFGEQLSFNPWNALAAHAPLGGINRARRAAYEAVSRHRHALNDTRRTEPAPATVALHPDNPLLDPSTHRITKQAEVAFLLKLRPDSADCVQCLLAMLDLRTPPANKRRHQEIACRTHNGADLGPDCLAARNQALRMPLETLPQLHFGRAFLCNGKESPEAKHLILSFCIDGDVVAFTQALAEVCGDALRVLVGATEAAPTLLSDADLGAFLLARRIKTDAAYRGHPERSVARIRNEATLRASIEEFLDTSPPRGGWSSLSAVEIRDRVKRHVFEEVSREWLKRPPPLPDPHFDRNLLIGAGLLLAVIVATSATLGLPAQIFWGIVLFGLGSAAALLYRSLERHDHRDRSLSQTHVRRPLVAEGPAPVHNWLTHVVDVKPGRLRRMVLSAFFAVVRLYAKRRELRGTLGGIPTIHFARWMRIDNGRQLVFVSNYDTSWDSYLDDFVYEAGRWLTSVWSNTEGFPRTEPFFNKGAKDEPMFKEWTRYHQIDTPLWYAAYPSLSVVNVNQNSRIRLGLYGEITETEALEWLRLFGRGQ